MATPLALPLGERAVLDALRREAHPLTGDHRDYDALLALIGDARIVLLGEASHGTHEFYRERARITKRLIAEHGFTALAIEGDWPDAYRVNRYIHGAREDRDAEEALRGFRRFPTWMWRNADVLDLVGWLRTHNDGLATAGPKGRLLRPRPLQPRRVDGGRDRLPRRAGPRRRGPGTRALRVPAALRRARAPPTARPSCWASVSRAAGG